MNRGWLLEEIGRAVSTALFGPPRARREPPRMPDDRNYGGPTKPFNGWPNLTRKDPW